MNGDALTARERERILRRSGELDERLYPRKGPGPKGALHRAIHDAYYENLQSYFDRLPRVRMGTCPVCGAPFEHSFDPFGLDGPWWHEERLCEVKEPANCGHFKVLLGAYRLRRPEPTEAVESVRPGPELPFVVPRLLELPGMIAVIGELEMATGDIAYPIAYFSGKRIRPGDLHAPWGRVEHWFETEGGHSGWNISNDRWDFDLRPYLRTKRLRWMDPGGDHRVRTLDDGPCPYADMDGVCVPQLFCDGCRDFLESPTGEIICPFE